MSAIFRKILKRKSWTVCFKALTALLRSGSPETKIGKQWLVHSGRQKIAFIDYDSEDKARYAMSGTKGFRFPASTRGISKD
jgi:hypothetical protein